ncbi:MAG: hypothetical protein R2847_04965 [Bacteroidia bacterium]
MSVTVCLWCLTLNALPDIAGSGEFVLRKYGGRTGKSHQPVPAADTEALFATVSVQAYQQTLFCKAAPN